MFIEDSCNPISHPLDEGEVNSRPTIKRVFLSLMTFASFEEGFKALFLTVTIIEEILQEMVFHLEKWSKLETLIERVARVQRTPNF